MSSVSYLMSGLKRIKSVLMNMVGWTMYRALMFFLYLQKKIQFRKYVITCLNHMNKSAETLLRTYSTVHISNIGEKES